MTTSRSRTSWLIQNYDKLMLVIVLMGLLVSALLLVLWINASRGAVAQGEQSLMVTPKMVKPIDLTALEKDRLLLSKPALNARPARKMMVSELRVHCVSCGKPIPYNAAKCPFCSADQPSIKQLSEMDSDADGIPDVYEMEHAMNAADHDDAQLDADGDGFSNLEEYLGGTNPNDANSHPSMEAKLRVARVGSTPFKFLYRGIATMPDGSVRHQINVRTFERTHIVKVGDVVEGIKVLEYIPASAENKKPALLVKQGDNTIRLVRDQEVTKEELYAVLVSLMDRQTYRVQVNQTITLKDRSYKIIDIERNGVLIRDTETNKDVTIGLLSEAERAMLMGGQVSTPVVTPTTEPAAAPAAEAVPVPQGAE